MSNPEIVKIVKEYYFVEEFWLRDYEVSNNLQELQEKREAALKDTEAFRRVGEILELNPVQPSVTPEDTRKIQV